MFQNLVANAIKFQRKGIVSQVEIFFNETKEHIVLGVKDNGIGIAEDDQALIFNIFKRLQPNSSVEGTGVGLAICEQIVNQMKGKIYIKSQVNVGSTFFIELPKQALVSMAATA